MGEMKNGYEMSTHYNGSVTLAYDDRKHKYFCNGKEVPSVTTVLQVMPKELLVAWAAKMAAEKFDEMVKIGEPLDEVRKSVIKDEIKWAYKNKTKSAQAIGTLAHKFAEDIISWKLLKGKRPDAPTNENVKNAARAFCKWVDSSHIKFVSAESKVMSKKHMYAGTCDIDAEIGGERCIVDLKTAKGIYLEHVCQVSAYVEALEEEHGTKYFGAWIVRIDKETGAFNNLFVDRTELRQAFNEIFAVAIDFRAGLAFGEELIERLKRESVLGVQRA